MRTRSLTLLVTLAAGCGPGSPPGGAGPDAPTGGADATPDAPSGCTPGHAGAPCVLDLYDVAIAGCDAAMVDELRRELDARAGAGPLWAGGRALFRTTTPLQVAGGFNDWSPTALRSSAVCSSDLIVAVGAVATGLWPYKLTDGQAWTLDPLNPAFAYDDFAGNPEGVNSVINTPDSGRGHLVQLDEACSTTLNNCRDVTAYLPPGYAAPATATTTYPVLFVHDGQNVWDDHDCCFGHTGWELNVTLDTEIAAARVAPVIVIAASYSNARNSEYGLVPATLTAFMQFQTAELQPHALTQVRWNGARVAVAGSSLGGLASMHLALSYPQVYAGAASLSGAFWPNDEALRAQLPTYGKQAVAIYLDHGGNVAQNTDGAADSVEVRDTLVGLGWQRGDSPGCVLTTDAVCYHSEPGATHDELAWRARAWRFLRFLFPAS